jgi:hypothetical protein
MRGYDIRLETIFLSEKKSFRNLLVNIIPLTTLAPGNVGMIFVSVKLYKTHKNKST